MNPALAFWHDRCDGKRWRQKARRGYATMIDLDVKCRRCGKAMTLRVGGEQARRIFLKDGALCEACHALGCHVGSAPDARASARPVSLPSKNPESV
jgi:hypothetical protein